MRQRTNTFSAGLCGPRRLLGGRVVVVEVLVLGVVLRRWRSGLLGGRTWQLDGLRRRVGGVGGARGRLLLEVGQWRKAQLLEGDLNRKGCQSEGVEFMGGTYLEVLVDTGDRSGVVELSCVVGRGEDGDQLPAGGHLVAVLHDLVGAEDHVDVEHSARGGRHFLAEGEADAAR